jgi:predicted MFS family arabinose efflux permease
MVSAGILGYLALASGLSALLIPGILLAYGAGWGFNGLFNLAVVRAYPHAPAQATGVTQVGAYLGGMLGPLGFGLLVDHAGYGAAWSMCAVAAALGAVTLFAARRLLARGLATDPGIPHSTVPAGPGAHCSSAGPTSSGPSVG